jgi:hypothetical protein
MKNLIFSLGFMVFLSLSSFANDLNPTKSKTTFSLYSAGRINQHPVYQLSLESVAQSEYQIIWKDADGIVLYEESLSGKEIIRNYMLDLGELSSANVIIEIYGRNGRKVQSFRISPNRDMNMKS